MTVVVGSTEQNININIIIIVVVDDIVVICCQPKMEAFNRAGFTEWQSGEFVISF